jgi:hypothetical protein
LGNVTGGATLGAQSTATLTILNDDSIQPGAIAFSNTQFSVNEDGTPVVAVTVTRTGGSDGEVSVTLTPSNGSAITPDDYANTPITVTFANGETSKTVDIPINDDAVYEPTETVNLTLSNPSNGATLGTQTTAVLNIIDNDGVPGVLSFSNATYNINENGTPVTQVTINRTGGSDGAVSATVTLSNGIATAGSDYVATPITVNFANGETSKNVTISIINDTVLENTEGGQYNINAYFPNNSNEDTAPEDSFQLLGMKFNSSQVTNKVIADTPFTGTVTVENITNIGITGITATVDSVVEGWNVQVNTPQNLAGSGNNTLTYTITAPNDPYITQDTFNIKLTSTEGATAVLPVNVNLERIVPRLVASTNLVSSGMLRGDQTVVEFEVTNEGGGIAENIEVLLPDVPWLKLASPATISALNPGQSTTVTLLLTPDANLPLTEYTGNLFLDAEGNDGDLSVNYNFRAISDAKGNISINTVDELFYFAEGAPKLANATVSLRDYFTNEVIATAVTDETGMLNLSNINEGYYNLEIKADRRDTFRQTIQLDAGETENIDAFLSRQTVQYIWNVIPTEIEDKYNIRVESVFETDVPIPVVVIDPPLIDYGDLQVIGQVKQVDMTITNHGLIAAQDLKLQFAEHPFYKVEPLIEDIGSLGAKSSLTIPIRITRIADFDTLTSNSNELATLATTTPSVSCSLPGFLQYIIPCRGGIPIGTGIGSNNVEGNCAPGGSGGFGGFGGGIFGSDGAPGGGIFSLVPRITISTSCDPTFNDFARCVLRFVPIFFPINNCWRTAFNCLAPGIATGEFKKGDVLSCLQAVYYCGSLFLGASSTSIGLPGAIAAIACVYDYLDPKFSFSSNNNQESSFQITSLFSPKEEQLEIFAKRLEKQITPLQLLLGDTIWLNVENSNALADWLNKFIAVTQESSVEGAKISLTEKAEGVTNSLKLRYINRLNPL